MAIEIVDLPIENGDEYYCNLLYTVITYLVGGDWNHGILNDFPETVGNRMSSSQLTKSIIFQRD